MNEKYENIRFCYHFIKSIWQQLKHTYSEGFDPSLFKLNPQLIHDSWFWRGPDSWFTWSLAPILSLLPGKISLEILASDWLKSLSSDWLKPPLSECGTCALLTYRSLGTGVILSGTCVCTAVLMLSSKYCSWIFADVTVEREILVQDRYFLIFDDVVSTFFFLVVNIFLLGWSCCVGGFSTTILVGFCCLEIFGCCISS